ncbi:TetR/AcrR family transcriptional regulator [Aliarcobacter cryaerophilus]|uniref:TetR/AcrR family transcriptional regulator n=2 Tax=Aliarcobacter cryaerophilus TaxID=28198 RepID=UPI003DA4DA52
MNKKKVSLLKEKIKSISLELFNSSETLSITTNHIAKSLGISVGNLYYHYKNKEEIIKDIYLQMSSEFEDLNIFDNVMKSETPFTELSLMFDLIGELFWKYRFLMRDSTLLIALDKDFKDIFIKNQEKRIKQIEILIEFLISKNIIRNISEEDIKMISKVSWFISAYWQTYISTNGELSKNSIKEAKDLIFKLHLEPLLVN